MWHLAIPAADIAARSAIIYLVLWAGLRLFGKREVGQFRLTDLVLVLLVANAVQPAMTGPDTSLLGGFVIIATLLVANYAWNAVVVRLGLRNPRLGAVLLGHPTVLVQDGQWCEQALAREGVDHEECEMAFREHGVESVADVKLAVLELDGTI